MTTKKRLNIGCSLREIFIFHMLSKTYFKRFICTREREFNAIARQCCLVKTEVIFPL